MAIDFDAVRRDFPLADTVAKVVPIKKAGRNMVACCPFHADKSPSFVLFGDNTYHCYGCGVHGDVIDFVAKTQRLSLSDAICHLTGGQAPVLDEADRQRRESDAKHRADLQRKREENAIQDARGRWARALPVNGTGNAYLERKNVAPYGTRREGDNLLVPIFGLDGLIQSVQSIAPDGAKLFHAGPPVTNGTMTLGDAQDGPVVVVEGFATGATVQAATGLVVIIGFSKGALKRTAQIASDRYQGREIIIAADTNGVDEARAAAEGVGGRVIAPDMQGADGSDFNDQAAHYGLEDVAASFAEVAAEVSADELGFRLTDWSMDRFYGEAPPIKWLCEGSIPLGVPAIFAAMGGVGKSFMALDMALEIAAEVIGGDGSRRILGGPIKEHGSVVVLGAEDGKDSVHRRLAKIDTGNRRERANGKLFVVPLPEVGGPMPLIAGSSGEFVQTKQFNALLRQLEQIKDLKLVILDPLQAFVVSDITKDPAAGQFMWSAFAHICAKTGATVIVCHHMRKDGAFKITTADEAREAIRGSTALIDGARATYALWGASDEDGRRVCQEAGVEFAPKRVVHGAVVKSNDEHDLDVHTYLRGANGLLSDAHDAGQRAGQKSVRMTDAQAGDCLKEINKRWQAGRPFSSAYNAPERYIVAFMQREYGIPKYVAKEQLSDWFHAQFIVTDVVDRKSKMTGLRVAKWPNNRSLAGGGSAEVDA